MGSKIWAEDVATAMELKIMGFSCRVIASILNRSDGGLRAAIKRAERGGISAVKKRPFVSLIKLRIPGKKRGASHGMFFKS